MIELIVVIAIVALIFALGLFMSMETFRGTLFRTDRDTALSILGRARSRAINNIHQTAWGVCYDDGAHAYVTFRGSTYVAGAATNESFDGSPSATITNFPLCSSGSGIVFAQLSGTTSPRNITLVENARTASISINDEGRIDW